MADGQPIVTGPDGSYSFADLPTGRKSLLVTWPNGQRTRAVHTRIETKQRPMRARIEIVDGVERCYALPGGHEVSC
jgi:hypothetical protein